MHHEGGKEQIDTTRDEDDRFGSSVHRGGREREITKEKTAKGFTRRMNSSGTHVNDLKCSNERDFRVELRISERRRDLCVCALGVDEREEKRREMAKKADETENVCVRRTLGKLTTDDGGERSTGSVFFSAALLFGGNERARAHTQSVLKRRRGKVESKFCRIASAPVGVFTLRARTHSRLENDIRGKVRRVCVQRMTCPF